MTVTNVDTLGIARGAHRHADGPVRGAFEKLMVGQRLKLQVLKRLDTQHYLESSSHDESDVAGLLKDLEAKYRLSLDEADRAVLEKAAAVTAHPHAMILSGLFLSRLDVPFCADALQAVYSAQASTLEAPSVENQADIAKLLDAVLDGDADSRDFLSQALMDGMPDTEFRRSVGANEAPTDPASLNVSGGSAESDFGEHAKKERQWAHELLNLQLDGSVAHQYGSIPLLVSGRLLEVDLVFLRQRQPLGASAPLHRLVMSLDTRSFGRVQVVAQSIDNRLVISFTGQTAPAADALASYAEDVRALGQRLGWSVEAVGYDFNPQQGRAAEHVVAHVVSAHSIDWRL